MGLSILQKADISYLENILLDEQGHLKVVPYEQLKDVPQEHLSVFCVQHGFYCIPTQELIDFLSEEIGDLKEQTIEIGAGNGVLCRELGIKGTDSFMQLNPEIKAHYENLKQAIVPYGNHLERLDALEAVRKYRPKIVLAAWFTHKYNQKQHWRGGNMYGVDEKKILDKVTKYIHIGNETVHNKKPILELPHKVIQADWLLSRSVSRDKNVIYIWE